MLVQFKFLVENFQLEFSSKTSHPLHHSFTFLITLQSSILKSYKESCFLEGHMSSWAESMVINYPFFVNVEKWDKNIIQVHRLKLRENLFIVYVGENKLKIQ